MASFETEAGNFSAKPIRQRRQARTPDKCTPVWIGAAHHLGLNRRSMW